MAVNNTTLMYNEVKTSRKNGNGANIAIILCTKQSDVMKCNIVHTDLFVKHYCSTEARKFVCVEFDFL